MKRRLVAGLGSVLLLTTSCSYVAGEATANYQASGGQTIGYVEGRPLSSTLTGHGASIGVGMVLNVLAGMWDAKMERKDRRKYAFDCLMRGKSEEECNVEASHRERIRRIYFFSLLRGQCTRSFWNPFSKFKKCYDEAFSDLESLTRGKTLEEALYQVYYDDELRDCLPDPLEYRDRTRELERKYAECRKKAEEYASEELSELREKISKYRARQAQANAE